MTTWKHIRQYSRWGRKRSGSSTDTNSLSQPLIQSNPPALTPGPLQELPPEILDQIIDELDDVSRTCLSLSSRSLRQYIRPGDVKLNPCAQWLIFCRLEADALAKGLPLPKKRAYPSASNDTPGGISRGGLRSVAAAIGSASGSCGVGPGPRSDSVAGTWRNGSVISPSMTIMTRRSGIELRPRIDGS